MKNKLNTESKENKACVAEADMLKLSTIMSIITIIILFVAITYSVVHMIMSASATKAIESWSKNNAAVIYQTYDGEGTIFENTKKEAFMEYYDKVNNNISQMVFGNDGKEYILIDGIEIVDAKSPIEICREVVNSATYRKLVRKKKIATNDSKGYAIKSYVQGYDKISGILGDTESFDAIMQYYAIGMGKKDRLAVYTYSNGGKDLVCAYIVLESDKDDSVYIIGKLFNEKFMGGELEIPKEIYEASRKEYDYTKSVSLAKTIVESVTNSLKIERLEENKDGVEQEEN